MECGYFYSAKQNKNNKCNNNKKKDSRGFLGMWIPWFIPGSRSKLGRIQSRAKRVETLLIKEDFSVSAIFVSFTPFENDENKRRVAIVTSSENIFLMKMKCRHPIRIKCNRKFLAINNNNMSDPMLLARPSAPAAILSSIGSAFVLSNPFPSQSWLVFSAQKLFCSHNGLVPVRTSFGLRRRIGKTKNQYQRNVNLDMLNAVSRVCWLTFRALALRQNKELLALGSWL